MKMTGGAWLLGLALASSVMSGCADADEPAGQTVDEATDEAEVLPAELGGSYDLHVEPKAVAGERGALKVLSFPVTPSKPFAAVMRRTDDSALDPWLALYAGGEPAAVSDRYQAVLPMAEESDAVIVYTPTEADELLLVAADRDMKARADFQIDLVTLEAPPTALGFTKTDAATRKITELLREREPETVAYLEAGMVSEGPDGLLVGHPTNAPLKDRAALNGFVAAVNDDRATLFEQIVRVATGAEDPALEPEVGAICSALWSTLRSDAHALR